jgi:hypothetical protein
MQNHTDSVRDLIKLLGGQTDKELDDQGPFLGVMIQPDDGRTWAEKEYEKDHQGWEKARIL